MAYQVEYRESGFHLTHVGEISIGEINEVNGRIQDSEHFDEHKYQLIDLLEADFSKISQSHSKMPGTSDAVASSRNEKVRVAIVAKDADAISFCKGISMPQPRWAALGLSRSFRLRSRPSSGRRMGEEPCPR